MRVAALFAVAGVTAGGLVGFAGGAGWSATQPGPAGPATAFGIVAAAVAADLAGTRLPALRPLAVRRQVPTAWSSVFAPETVAVLYGARLGVGPLTILPTWLWWAALLIGASAGPWVGAATGAAFAATRAAATLVAAEAIADDAPTRMARLVALGRAGAPVLGVAALGLGAATFALGG